MIHKQSIVKRAGITITEALASIAIAATGLFAVLAIIPFAARQTEAGLELDVAVSVGKNAVHDFDVRGMGRVSNWRIAYVPPNGASPERFNVIPANSYWAGKAVVIDPLFINQNIYSLPIIDKQAISSFPYPLFDVDPTVSRAIDRINLSSNGVAYTYAHSEGIFRSINELVFNDPTNDLDNPIQSLNRDGTVDTKRNYQGKISWMAMVVPDNNVGVNPHMYRLYVIVFKDRQLNYRPSNPAGEAVYEATANGSTIGGGTFGFRVTEGQLRQDDYLNSGDWVLLTDHRIDSLLTPIIPPQTPDVPTSWRWYQIQRVDPPQKAEQIRLFSPAVNGTANVTLQGSDWAGTTDNATARRKAWAIVLSNVISVYEKTIRIEYDSIWNE